MSRASSPPRIRRRLVVPLVGVLAVVATACLPVTLPFEPGTARPFFCDPTDTAINDGHAHGGGHMMNDPFHQTYTQPKGPLSGADCRALNSQLMAAQQWVMQFPTVADAEAAGFKQAAVWSPGQGIHYVDPNRLTGPFDPTRPNWLMYDGTAPNSKLTGMMFLVASGTYPPAGFPGGNDHWHTHGALCTQMGSWPFIIGEHLTDAECAAIGGVNTLFDTMWMVHVWLPEYAGWQATDIFNKTHPAIP